MAEILHFEILRKHGKTNTQTHKQTNTQTHKQTDMGITIPRPPPMGGEVISLDLLSHPYNVLSGQTLYIQGTLPCVHFYRPIAARL